MSKSGVFNTIGSILGMANSGVNGASEIATSYMESWREARELARAETSVEVQQGWTTLENKVGKLVNEGKLRANSKENVLKFLKGEDK